MPKNDDSTLRGMWGGRKTRRHHVNHLLEPGEVIDSDCPAFCVAAPTPHDSDRHPGHFLVTTKRFIYVPDDEDTVSIRFDQIGSVAFMKQQRGWVVVEFTTDSGEIWAITGLPSTARSARRRLKKETSAALR